MGRFDSTLRMICSLVGVPSQAPAKAQGKGKGAKADRALSPAEQAAALARDVDPELAAAAAACRSDPCWTVMLAFDRRLPIADDVLKDEGDLPWAARDSSKPGRGAAETWVLQAGPAWSRAHLEDEPATVIAALCDLFARGAGVTLPTPLIAQAHRWRYARSGRDGRGCRWNGAERLGACGDWLIGPRVENAWLSGRMLAERMIGIA